MVATVFRCPCGHPSCKKWLVSPGADYQGCGWEEESTARAVADLLDQIERRKLTEVRKKRADAIRGALGASGVLGRRVNKDRITLPQVGLLEGREKKD
jgi:hypothetical protein